MKKIIIPSKWSLGYYESRSDASKGIKKENSFHYPFYWQFKPENFNIGAQGDFLKLLFLEERHNDKFQ